METDTLPAEAAASPNGVRPRAAMTAMAWDGIQRAIAAEAHASKVVARILHAQGPRPDAVNVPSDIVTVSRPDGDRGAALLTVNENDTTGITEPRIQISLTQTQVEREEQLRSGLTLATRAASLLSLA